MTAARMTVARRILLAVALLALPTPVAAEAMPGVIDLAGPFWVRAGDGEETTWEETMLPASWRRLGLEGHDGPVWFRREVRLPPDWRQTLAPSGLAVMVGPAKYGPYELLVGNRPVGGYRGLGLGVPAPAHRAIAVPPELVPADGRLGLTLRFDRVGWASDRAAGTGPVGERLLVGDRSTIESLVELEARRQNGQAVHAVLLAALLGAVGLYHLQLYSRRRESIEYLWFALVALDSALLVFAVQLSYRVFPSYQVGRRLIDLTIHLLVVLLIQLLWPYLGRGIDRWLRRYQLSHLVIAAAILVVPLEWVVRSNELRWLWFLPFLIGLARVLAVGSWRGDPDARTIGLGGLALIGVGVAELVYQVQGWGTIYPLPAWAFGFFALSMAVSLSNRYSRLHRELDTLSVSLEQEVEERTAELAAANRKLRAENAERELVEESMRMLERAVEQSIDGMVVADLAGATEFMNEAWARMHGYEVPEALGYDLNLFHTREQMQHEVYPLLKAVRETGRFSGEVGHRRRDGEAFPTYMTANLLRDAGGESVGIVAIARDVTDRRRGEEERLRLETQLQRAAKLESLADLAAGIAHDYNNLLTGMLIDAGHAAQVVDGDERERVEEIERAAERAADLSDQLLAIAGEDQPELRTLALNDFVSELEPMLRQRVPEEIVLQLQLRKRLPPVDVDPAQIRRAIQRLVANAVEAIGAGSGVITIRTSRMEADEDYFLDAHPVEERPAGAYVFFEVSDSGSGIEEEIRDRVFEPFFSTKEMGRGLGLATVMGIIGAHRGAVKVFSEPGRGTTVAVLFPASTSPAAEEPASLEHWRGTGTVLVVDDEELVVDVTQDILERRGFAVLTAGGGTEALELYAEHRERISVVLLDITMPGMDGQEVFRRLRAIDSRVRVVLMSGFSRKKISQETLDQGLGGFLHKPFRPDELIRTLRDVME